MGNPRFPSLRERYSAAVEAAFALDADPHVQLAVLDADPYVQRWEARCERRGVLPRSAHVAYWGRHTDRLRLPQVPVVPQELRFISNDELLSLVEALKVHGHALKNLPIVTIAAVEQSLCLKAAYDRVSSEIRIRKEQEGDPQ